MATKYLYGASIQGIQSFIFQTSKLTEIIGASELVEQICTLGTKDFLEQKGIEFKGENQVLSAAGNIKYVFDNNTECERMVKEFPLYVMEKAPGITISQAVVVLENKKFNDALTELEEKLKVQRSIAQRPHERGFMGVERSRRTGGVGFIERNKRKGGVEVICEATHLKRVVSDPQYKLKNDEQPENLFEKISGLSKAPKSKLAFDIEDITRSGNNKWIAVMHADGNGLGAILIQLVKEFKCLEDEKVKIAFKAISEAIEEATKAAAQSAYRSIENKFHEQHRIPLRPVILGGDDITLIIRGDLALDFTEMYLKTFEDETKKRLGFLKEIYKVTGFENGITASAGVAYVKEAYPLHYALHLAEMLCKDAKKFVKNNEKIPMNGMIPKSSLAFLKMHDSFVEDDLSDIKKRTLTANGFNLFYGPYLIDKFGEHACLADLKEKVSILETEAQKSEKTKAVSKLRQWVSELYKDKATADFMLDRIEQVNTKFYKDLKIGEERIKPTTILYDAMQIHSLKF